MAQPSILGIGTKSKVYTSTDTSGNRTFDLDVPADANIVAVNIILDVDDNNSNAITGLTHTGLTGAVELFDIDASKDNTRATRIGIYDVRKCGAGTLEVTAALAGGATCICACVMTDGFIESFYSFIDRQVDNGTLKVHSGNNDNNILVLLATHQNTSAGGSFTTGTEIFITDSSDNEVAGVAASQATTTNGLKIINYVENATQTPMVALAILFSSQPNAFGDIDPRGDIISHDIISN